MCEDSPRRSVLGKLGLRAAAGVALGGLALVASAMAGACHSHQEGMRIDAAVATTGGSAEIETDLGYRITLSRAFVSVAAHELSLCDDSSAALHASPGAWLALPTAIAHSTSSPTRSGTPYVVDLLTGSTSLESLEPPPGSYCGWAVELAPVDADAEGLAAAPEVEGRTLWIEGTLVSPDGEETPLSLSSTEPEYLAFDVHFVLSEGAPSAEAQLASSLPTWFDGIDFDAEDPANWSTLVFERMLDAWEATAL